MLKIYFLLFYSLILLDSKPLLTIITDYFTTFSRLMCLQWLEIFMLHGHLMTHVSVCTILLSRMSLHLIVINLKVQIWRPTIHGSKQTNMKVGIYVIHMFDIGSFCSFLVLLFCLLHCMLWVDTPSKRFLSVWNNEIEKKIS